MERPSDDGARPSQGQDRRQDVPNPLARPAGDEPGWERVPVGVSEARRLAALPQGGAFLALRAEGADLFIPRVEGYNPEAPLPLPLALALTALVAEALEPVHDQGGAFGELSPSGILFDRHGVLRIRPAPRQTPLAAPQGGAITPATDSLWLGGLLRYWLGGGWPSQTLKATPEAGALNPLGVKVVLEGLSRSLPKLRLQPERSRCRIRRQLRAHQLLPLMRQRRQHRQFRCRRAARPKPYDALRIVHQLRDFGFRGRASGGVKAQALQYLRETSRLRIGVWRRSNENVRHSSPTSDQLNRSGRGSVKRRGGTLLRLKLVTAL